MSATFRIQHKLKAAELLISKNADVNKVNERDETLLSYMPNLEIFKLLVDHGADVKALDGFGVSPFQRAIQQENPAYLQHILMTGKAMAQDFTPAQQVDFWMSIRSAESAYWLKEYGFTVNVKDEKGYTPLLKLVKTPSAIYYPLKSFNSLSHVNSLLACGADPSITVREGNVEKNALQLATDPAIRALLEQA